MRYVNRSPAYGGPAPRLHVTPWVRILLIANAAVFLIAVAVGPGRMFDLFAFSPGRVLVQPWGMLTYMFLHAGVWHLLMNLLFIFFFGPPLEARWGSDRFIKFYLICGLGGVLLSFAFSNGVIVGASAACYGIMLAFAMAWPNQTVYIWALVPVRVKWLVIFLVAMSFVSAISPSRDGVAHLAHLGGAVAGFLLVKSGWLPAYGGGSARLGGRGPGAGGAGVRGRGVRRRRGGWGGAWSRLVRRKPSGLGSWKAREPERRARRPEEDPVEAGFLKLLDEHMAERRVRQELDRVDQVLDKISAEGINSLTAEERALLDRVSRQTQLN